MEASPGIEPACKDLQALPCYCFYNEIWQRVAPVLHPVEQDVRRMSGHYGRD